MQVHGPENCPRRCSECPEGKHHWLEQFPNPDDEDDELRDHPATVAGLVAFCVCKHCDAWTSDIDEAMGYDVVFDSSTADEKAEEEIGDDEYGLW